MAAEPSWKTNLAKAQETLKARRLAGEKIGGRPKGSKKSAKASAQPPAPSAVPSSAGAPASGPIPSATPPGASPSSKPNAPGDYEIPPRADPAAGFGPRAKKDAPGGQGPGATVTDKAALAKQIQGFHELAALFTGIQELRIEAHEAAMLADAAVDVMAHYSIEINPKHAALVKLAAAAGMVYGPRVFVVAARTSQAKKQRQQTRGQRVTEIRPGASTQAPPTGFDPYGDGSGVPSGASADSAGIVIPPGSDEDNVTH